MTSKERMKKVINGEHADRIPFMPTILEHAASMIDKTPSETARDEHLLAEAHIKAYARYGHDAVTAGIDIYNIEAEALGCEIRYHDDDSIPGVMTHPFPDGFENDDIIFLPDAGRYKIILSAASQIYEKIGNEVSVSVPICGPFSVCCELMGFENFLMFCLYDHEHAIKMLDIMLDHQREYAKYVIRSGFPVVIFESWASPPLISPVIYSRFVAPYEKELINTIRTKGISYVPLIIGGDTSDIVDEIIMTGTGLIVSDYNTDAKEYIKKAKNKDIVLRANIDPKMIKRENEDALREITKSRIETGRDYEKFVIGTGVVPYNASEEALLFIKNVIEGS